MALITVGLFAHWQYLHSAPADYDEAMYLVVAWSEWAALRARGFLGFLAALIIDGHPNLLSLIGLSGFLAFGPSYQAALVPFAFVWLAALWAVYDFAETASRHLFKFEADGSAGFFACLLFATYPLTVHLSHQYLVEFPLITMVAVSNAFALRYFVTGRKRWAGATGIAIGLGLLAKVTFPAFAISAAIFILIKAFRSSWTALLIVLLPIGLIAGPVYLPNLARITHNTRFLASEQLAALHGLGGGFQLDPTLAFMKSMLTHFEFVLALTTSIVAGTFIFRNRQGRGAYMLLLASFLVPFLIVAASHFKLERYTYAAFFFLFVLGGYGLTVVWSRRPMATALAAVLLFALPVTKVAVSNTLVPPSSLAFLDRIAANLGLSKLTARAAAPARLEWNVSQIVSEAMPLIRSSGPVYLIGASSTFHVSLLRFEALRQGFDRDFTYFPYHEAPKASGQDIFRHIEATKSSAVIYRKGPYDGFLGQGVEEAATVLSSSPLYSATVLRDGQPDGSRFVVFTRKVGQE